MKRANNIQNLRPFKKGQSGNLKGRPKKLPSVYDLLDEVITEDTRRTILRMLAAQAKKGNMKAIEIVLDRLYGKVRQQTEISGNMSVASIVGMIIQRDDGNDNTEN